MKSKFIRGKVVIEIRFVGRKIVCCLEANFFRRKIVAAQKSSFSYIQDLGSNVQYMCRD